MLKELHLMLSFERESEKYQVMEDLWKQYTEEMLVLKGNI